MSQQLLCWHAQGAKTRLAKAEQALELLLEAQLGAGHSRKGQGCSDDEACSYDSWPAGMQDDYIDSDAEAADSHDDSTASSGDRALMTMNSTSKIASANIKPEKSTSIKAKASEKMKLSGQCLEQKAQGLNGSASEAPGGKGREVIDDSHPDSFSQVDLSRPQQEIETLFPLFPVMPCLDQTNAWRSLSPVSSYDYMPVACSHRRHLTVCRLVTPSLRIEICAVCAQQSVTALSS